MRIPVLIAALACAAWGQAAEQVFPFTFTESPQAMQEVTNGMRAILDIQQVKVDSFARTLTASGTPEQMGAATWLFPELVKPSGPKEYRLTGVRDPVVRVYPLTKTTTPQGTQEIINAIRSISEVQRIVSVNQARAIVLRGSEDQVAVAEWMIQALDLDPGTQSAPMLSLKANLPPAPAARIFYLSASQTPQGMQEIVNAVRSVTEIQRVVNVWGPRAMVIRGTAGEVEMAEWLMAALDRPAGAAAVAPFPMASTGELARVFYLKSRAKQQDLQDLVNTIRSEAKIQRAVLVGGYPAIVLRGTAGQVALAEKLIEEKEQL